MESFTWNDGSRKFCLDLDGALFELDDSEAGPQSGEVPGFVARELFALAARVAELEALAEEDDESLMNAGLYLGEVALRNDALEAVIAPLLPLFREWRADRERAFRRPGQPLPRVPDSDTITLTAEFPVEALRALTKE